MSPAPGSPAALGIFTDLASVLASVLVATAAVAALVGAVRRQRQRASLLARWDHPAGSVQPPRRPPSGHADAGTLVAAAVDGWRAATGAVGAPLRRRAGRPVDPDADRRVGGSLLLAVIGLGLGVGPVVAVAGGVATWTVPLAARLRRRARARSVRADETPEIVDLVRLGIGAGLNVRLAIEAVVRHHDGPLAADLGDVLDRVARGERLADAIDSLATTTGDAVQPLLDALVATERYGAPLVASLDLVAADARTARRRRREEAARRVPVKLLFPLVFCTLPAFALLTVVPVLLRSLPSLAP